MSNNPDDFCDPAPLKVELRLTPTAQASTLLQIADCCRDIVEDLDRFPGTSKDGRLLGIRTVAEQQIARLENIAANIRADWSIP